MPGARSRREVVAPWAFIPQVTTASVVLQATARQSKKRVTPARWATTAPGVTASRAGDRHGLPFPPLRPPGPAALQFQQGRVEFDLRWGPRCFLQHPDEPHGGACTTVGLPSTGLRSGQLDALKQTLLAVLHQDLIAPGSLGEQLWDQGLVSRLLANGSLPARTTGLLALMETPEAMEAYLLRAQGQDDAKRRAHRCISAVQEALRLIDDQRMLG